MKPASRSLLNRLLSGGEGLSAVDKEEVLGKVLEQPQVRRPGGWKLAAFGLGLSAVAASLIAVTWFSDPAPAEFVARGVPGADLDLACLLGEAKSNCRDGSRLLFKVRPGGARYLSVLAVGPDQRLLWFLDGTDLALLPPNGVLPQAAVIGPEHGTGVFDVVAVFSAEALSKSQVRAIAEGKQSPQGGSVLRRTLTIDP